jgi:NADH-quinone oxidoreductase subunit N
MGKLFLLTAAWNRGYNWLIIIAALNTAISIYYYLNIVRHAYTQESEALLPENAPRCCSAVWGGVLAASLLVLGIIPQSVFCWMEEATRQMMP